MCVCVHTYIYVCTFIHTYTTCLYMCVCVHIYTDVYTYKRKYICILICTYVYVHATCIYTLHMNMWTCAVNPHARWRFKHPRKYDRGKIERERWKQRGIQGYLLLPGFSSTSSNHEPTDSKGANQKNCKHSIET